MRTIITICILVATVAGCMSIDKATNKVLTDPAAKEKVGREWEKENPCPPPPIPLIKSDTAYLPGDTTYLPGDTTYLPGDKTVITLPGKVVTKTVVIRDSIPYDVTDYRRLGIALDSIRQYKVWLETEKVENARLNAEHKQVGTMLQYAILALLKKWRFWLIVAVGLGLLYLNNKVGILSILNRK